MRSPSAGYHRSSQLSCVVRPLSDGVQSFVRTEVGKVVASDAFDAWVTANRSAHTALVAALTGQTGEGITIANGTVSINLAHSLTWSNSGWLIEDSTSRIASLTSIHRSLSCNRMPSPKLKVLSVCSPRSETGRLWWYSVMLALGVYVAKDHRRALMELAWDWLRACWR